jgi:hypothetical protein
MEKLFDEFPYDQKRHYDQSEAVDVGQELHLLQVRSQQRLLAEPNALQRIRRQNNTLRSQLQTSTAHAQSDRYPGLGDIQYEHGNKDREFKEAKYGSGVDSPSVDGRDRPVRATRAPQRFKTSPPPLPPRIIEKYSQVHGITPVWEHPVVYPLIGKKRTTVVFSDLERLDEDEMLNDNLIEFYIRWLAEQYKLPDRQVYFFGTHFYTALTTGGKRGFNYEAVQRWTAKDDIFSYDFVVVPVNES